MTFTMRKPCVCGCDVGRIVEKGAQDCVYCSQCGRWNYNAPRSETGKPTRSVSDRDSSIKPAKRAKVLLRATGRCELCGKKPSDEASLHVGHLLSVKDAESLGVSREDTDSMENLAAMCDECNLGLSEETVPLRLAAAIVIARSRNQQ